MIIIMMKLSTPSCKSYILISKYRDVAFFKEKIELW